MISGRDGGPEGLEPGTMKVSSSLKQLIASRFLDSAVIQVSYILKQDIDSSCAVRTIRRVS
jgi:hypothetical protein